MIRLREAERRALFDRLEHEATIADLDPTRVLAELQGRLNDWRELLRDNTPKARGLVKQLIVGRLLMTSDHEARLYRFNGTGTLEPFISGILTQLGFHSVVRPQRAWTIFASR